MGALLLEDVVVPDVVMEEDVLQVPVAVGGLVEVVEELAGVVVGVLVSGERPDTITAIAIQIVALIYPFYFVLNPSNKVGTCGVNHWLYGES